ncbi:hypothetical protein [Candidatus Cytomitobacter indipagum]|nr:hypothetical protein [Candidatus Cytomitobacter indipagum]
MEFLVDTGGIDRGMAGFIIDILAIFGIMLEVIGIMLEVIGIMLVDGD